MYIISPLYEKQRTWNPEHFQSNGVTQVFPMGLPISMKDQLSFFLGRQKASWTSFFCFSVPPCTWYLGFHLLKSCAREAGLAALL